MTDPHNEKHVGPDDGSTDSARGLAAIGWPCLVAVMLLGHAGVVMVGLTLGRVVSAAVETIEPGGSGSPPAAIHASAGGATP